MNSLCLSSEIFDVVEKQEKIKTQFLLLGISLILTLKEWELLLPEMWGSYLPLFDWSLSSLPKALFYWCGNSFSAWEGKFRTVASLVLFYRAVIGVELWLCVWVGATRVWASGRLKSTKGQSLSDIWFPSWLRIRSIWLIVWGLSFSLGACCDSLYPIGKLFI